MEHMDYYQSLDVDKTATGEEIRQAYRKLARKYHPDVNPDDEQAIGHYMAINEAHQVLTHPDARARYDQLSASWQAHLDAEDDTEFAWKEWCLPKFITDSKIDLDKLGQENQTGYSNFYAAIFSEMDFSQEGITPSKGQDYHQKVEITLEEALIGTTRILRVGGRRLEVRIPKGATSGTKVRVRGEGAPGIDDGPKGDLYLEIEIAPHPSLQRVGDDLHLELPVNFFTAILGGEAIVETLKGVIKLKIPQETQAGRVFRIRGQGMPNIKNPDQRGDLFAKVIVTLPENLTEEEIELFEELADIRGL